MNKEKLFEEIDEIYSEWHGGELHIGTERTERIKETLNRAINFIPCCTELPTSTELLSDCKKRFKELEGKGNLDFRSYKNGYLDSFSKNVISKIK